MTNQPFCYVCGGVIVALLLSVVLVGCEGLSPRVIDAAMSGDPERIARVVVEEELQRQGLPADLNDLPDLIAAVRRVLSDVWGEKEPETASEHRYVKYSGDWQARAIVDFDEGWLRVETIAEEGAIAKLRMAIIQTLLTDRNMTLEDIFTDSDPTVGGEPFLYRQVLDAEGQAIRWQWRAERFADYLLANALVTAAGNKRTVRGVQIDLVADHLQLRELEYSAFVLESARRYAVAPSLIYAVIEVESAFNPYAVSPAKAFGLMQVVPATAGRDVYERVKKQRGEPTRTELFQPDFNIDIGSAYLYLLDGEYLSRIRNSSSRRYATIASYNGGSGSTLKAFHANRDQAIQKINAMSPSQVYQTIVDGHPFSETRRYLEKVTAAQRSYQ